MGFTASNLTVIEGSRSIMPFRPGGWGACRSAAEGQQTFTGRSPIGYILIWHFNAPGNCRRPTDAVTATSRRNEVDILPRRHIN
jgi:hypothetical protein